MWFQASDTFACALPLPALVFTCFRVVCAIMCDATIDTILANVSKRREREQLNLWKRMGERMRSICLGVISLRVCVVVVVGGSGPKKMEAGFVVVGSGYKQKGPGAHTLFLCETLRCSWGCVCQVRLLYVLQSVHP